MALGVGDDMGAGHPPVAVEVDLHLRHVELEGPTVFPPGPQHAGQIAHPPQERADLAGHLDLGRARVGEELIDLFVREPATAADRRPFDVGVDGNPVSAELDPAGPRVAHSPRLEAGEVVGDDLREHRDHPVGKIDARATGERLLVDRRPLRHEMGNVGDVDPEEPVIAFQTLERDRVVEVAGIDRIDRDDRPRRQIPSISRDSLGKPRRLGPGGVEDLVGERAGETELVDDRTGVDPRLPRLPEDLDDHPFAISQMGGEADDLDDDLVILADRLGPGIADRHRPRERRAVDLHPARIGGDEKTADEPGLRPAHHLDDLARQAGAAEITPPREPDPDGVAVDRIETGRLGDMDIPLPAPRGGRERMDEAVASGGAAEDPDDLVAPPLGLASRRCPGGRPAHLALAAAAVGRSFLLIARHRWPPSLVGNRAGGRESAAPAEELPPERLLVLGPTAVDRRFVLEELEHAGEPRVHVIEVVEGEGLEGHGELRRPVFVLPVMTRHHVFDPHGQIAIKRLSGAGLDLGDLHLELLQPEEDMPEELPGVGVGEAVFALQLERLPQIVEQNSDEEEITIDRRIERGDPVGEAEEIDDMLEEPAGVGVMVLDPGGAAAEDRHQGPVGEHLVGELPELARGDRRQERCQLPPQPEDVGSREDLELRLIDDARIDPSDPLDDELEIP